jgi:hypothetical protein
MTPRLKAVAEWRSLDRGLKIDRGSTIAPRASKRSQISRRKICRAQTP